MSTNRIYVPALKWKAGEWAALAELGAPTRAAICPVMEFVPPRKRSLSKADKLAGKTAKDPNTIERQVEIDTDAIARVWADAPFYLDPRLQAEKDGCGVFPMVFNACRDRSLGAIPVVTLGAAYSCLAEVIAIAKRDGRGACIRIQTPRDAALVADARAVMQSFPDGTPIDLFVDLGNLNMEMNKDWLDAQLRPIIHQLRLAVKPRNLSVVGGSIPTSLPKTPDRHPLERFEWTYYGNYRSMIDPLYVFGDYAVNTAVYSAGGSGGPPNIRYADDSGTHLVFRGSDDPTTDSKGNPRSKYHHLHQLAKDVQADPAWKHSGYSWGDGFIHEVSKREERPGSQTDWRAVGTCHHITRVVEQLTKLAAPVASALRLT